MLTRERGTVDTTIKRGDFRRYLGVLYFGVDQPGFRRYISRAYRDLSRTLHTADSAGSRDERVEVVNTELSARLVTAAAGKKVKCKDESAFDRWHEETCESLIVGFGGTELSYGHAQKWLNMSLEYLFTAHVLKLADIGKIEAWYPFAHMPIDNVVLDQLADLGFPYTCPRPWSKLTKDDYLAFQSALRKTYKQCPIDVEFMLWRGDGNPTPRD